MMMIIILKLTIVYYRAEFRSQLREAPDTVVAETHNIKKKRMNTDYMDNRKELMKDLAIGILIWSHTRSKLEAKL